MKSMAASSKCCRSCSICRAAIAKSPSLFDRDAYQAYLREHTNEVSAMRFDIQWQAAKADGDAELEAVDRTPRRG